MHGNVQLWHVELQVAKVQSSPQTHHSLSCQPLVCSASVCELGVCRYFIMRANNRHQDHHNRRFFTVLGEIIRAVFPHPPDPPAPENRPEQDSPENRPEQDNPENWPEQDNPENWPEQDNTETSQDQVDAPDAPTGSSPTNTEDPKPDMDATAGAETSPAEKPRKRRVATVTPPDASVRCDEDKK